jgi:drug/metabolite transporter (DMT)-like permease
VRTAGSAVPAAIAGQRLTRLAIRSAGGAYVAMAVLTLLWGSNWLTMKVALGHAHPAAYNIHRILVAIAVLFAVLLVLRRPLWPESWRAVAVTGFFQTTISFGATTMALAEGGVGRTAVLVFTMPFWTILIAWPLLHERLRGTQWLAVGLALAGLTLIVEPWDWRGALAPKLWAVLSGFGWAAGTIAIKYFQRERSFDTLNLMAWQMAVGLLPLLLVPLVQPLPATDWSAIYALLLLATGAVSTALGFVLWVTVLRWVPAGTASLCMLAIPVIALLSSMLVFAERLTAAEWTGIACVGAGLVIISLRAWRSSRQGKRDVAEPPLFEGG